MKHYSLKIETLSDLCVGNGRGFNSSLDTDVCQDAFGFPYIPGKRIRGLLRECAIVLKEWGEDNIDPDGLFGKEGNQNSNVRIGSAELEELDKVKSIIAAHPDSPILMPQNILNAYTHIRTNTAIDYETGVADDQSLRAKRVINKGTTFVAPVELADEKEEEAFKKCCLTLRHMGLNRTRGLGDVRVTLEDSSVAQSSSSEKKTKSVLKNGATRLDYIITLLEPVICKSVTTGESKTLDYIDGAKVLGLIATDMDNDSFSEFMNSGNPFFSNAYVMQDNLRLTEVPATLYGVKNHPALFRNKLYEYEPNWPEKGDALKRRDDIILAADNETILEEYQLNQAKHCYVSISEDEEKFIKKNVRTEEHYHHRRPKDKSIGRAQSNTGENSHFYTISCIAPGQSFGGFVTGSEEQIKTVYNVLSKTEYAYIGYGRTSEYGRVQIIVTQTSVAQKSEIVNVKKLTFKLESPTIIYNENACYSTNKEELKNEILAALSIEENEVESASYYLNYTTVGGFNVTWKRRKPTVQAFDKGSVVVFGFSKEIDLTIPANCYLGERTTEGFGEFSVEPVNDDGRYTLTQKKMSANSPDQADLVLSDESPEVLKTICHSLMVQFAKAKGLEAASESSSCDNDKALIANLTSMCKESECDWEHNKDGFNWELDLTTRVTARFDKTTGTKEKKKDTAISIIKEAKDHIKLIEADFSTKYKIKRYSVDENEIAFYYLNAYLQTAKHIIKEEKSNG